MPSKYEAYELESLLHEITDKGYVIIHIGRLWRLLNKGARSPGTWRALLDAYEELGNGRQRSDLHMFETNHEYLIITKHPTESLVHKAGEA